MFRIEPTPMKDLQLIDQDGSFKDIEVNPFVNQDLSTFNPLGTDTEIVISPLR